MATYLCSAIHNVRGVGECRPTIADGVRDILREHARVPGLHTIAQGRSWDHEAIDRLAVALHQNPPEGPLPVMLWRWIIERWLYNSPTDEESALVAEQLARPEIHAELARIREPSETTEPPYPGARARA